MNWQAGHRNVMAVMPTGAGKSVLTGSIVGENRTGGTCVAAHRGELVSQLSLALAREGVRHRIIGSSSLRRDCASLHMMEINRDHTDPGARVGVCSVDTLIRKDMSEDSYYRGVNLWVQDEAHHVLAENKWGKVADMFPNAWGLGPTATPTRADGKGLGRTSDGVFDALVVGPGMRELIDAGFLTDYRIFTPPSDVDYSEVTVTASGDLSMPKLRHAVHASDTIVGDVVKQYLRICPGKRGIAFAVDVEAAQQIARAFRAAGVPSEVVTADTPDALRIAIMRQFRAGDVKVLVNVDLFGEGVDVPACEVVMMVRKTESWPLFVQQFGRALRLLIPSHLQEIWDDFTDEQRRAHIAASGKPCGVIIDHVGNCFRHGLPDAYRVHTLDRRTSRASRNPDAIPLQGCLRCFAAYERYRVQCPHCGWVPVPVVRTAPEMVDGDLYELDAATLRELRGEVNKIDGAARIPMGVGDAIAGNIQKMHFERQQAQGNLRNTLSLWAGWKKHERHDLTDREIQKMFFLAYGVDVMSAMALGRPDAEKLTAKMTEDLARKGVIAA